MPGLKPGTTSEAKAVRAFARMNPRLRSETWGTRLRSSHRQSEGSAVWSDEADAGLLVGALATLGIAVCVAGLIPAKRAASIDPVEALRTE